MHRRARLTVGTLACAAIIAGGLMTLGACGDNSNNPNDAGQNPDGQPTTDGSNPQNDGSPGNDGGGDTGTDGGCTFAGYVIGLITTNTNATATPDTTLGAGCVDNQSQAEFAPLFP